jgi:hypothetical protein
MRQTIAEFIIYGGMALSVTLMALAFRDWRRMRRRTHQFAPGRTMVKGRVPGTTKWVTGPQNDD